MWILIGAIVVVSITPFATRWYAKRRTTQSMRIVQDKLREFETIADMYTKDGTPQELRKLMGELEEIRDELQFIDDNNPNNPNNKVE